MRARVARRIFTGILVVLVAIVMAVEDALWFVLDWIRRHVAWIPFMAVVDRWIAGVGPYGMLAMLCLPALVIIPAKMFGLWLVATHHLFQGVAVILAAKLVGMAILVHLYAAGRNRLLSIGWFRWLHEHVLALKTWAYGSVRATAVWRWFHLHWSRLKTRGGLWARLAIARRFVKRKAA